MSFEDPAPLPPGVPVPATRLGRLARLGGMATGIAGAAAWQGAQALARGRRPALHELVLTPANAARLTGQLAQMRGAAMKVGQLMSMDAGELLPPDLAQILARLRAEAHPMPPQQLKAALTAAWGPGWQRRFAGFEVRPIAAASIGQVHRARIRDGRDLAIKVQYPGVRRSIDSDVGNVGTLIRLSGLMPPEIDLAGLLDEARRQLHDEADYLREAAQLARFGDLLAGDPGYRVPALAADLTTADVLAMEFVAGTPIAAMEAAPAPERDRLASLLAALTLRELYEFGVMQTDPNFANFLYDRAGGRLVLLDFGAARDIPAPLAAAYQALLAAGLSGEGAAIAQAAEAAGLFGPGMPEAQRAALLDLGETAFALLRQAGPVDVAATGLMAALRDTGIEIAGDPASRRRVGHVPPMDTLLVQRKLGGVYMLAHRLGARLDLQALIAPFRPAETPAA